MLLDDLLTNGIHPGANKIVLFNAGTSNLCKFRWSFGDSPTGYQLITVAVNIGDVWTVQRVHGDGKFKIRGRQLGDKLSFPLLGAAGSPIELLDLSLMIERMRHIERIQG